MAGLAWETVLPVLVEDISKADTFIRASDAQKAGISMDIGIPVSDNPEQSYIHDLFIG